MGPRSETYLSVVIPAYNEEDTLRETVAEVTKYLEKQGLRHEIIIVNDGSSDSTALCIESLMQTTPAVQGIHLPRNRGKGYAVKEGVARSLGDVVLFMDADHSVHIRHLDVLLRHLEEGFDVVVSSIALQGSTIKDDNHQMRRLFGTVAKLLIRAATMLEVRDTQRGFKLFSRKAAQEIFSRQVIERWGFDIELLVIAKHRGFKVKEVPVAWDNKKSDVGVFDYLYTLGELLRITINTWVRKY